VLTSLFAFKEKRNAFKNNYFVPLPTRKKRKQTRIPIMSEEAGNTRRRAVRL
jgi:hypothetical protein